MDTAQPSAPARPEASSAPAVRSAGVRRDPDRTRERIIQAAFQEIYRNGFRAAGLDTILSAAGVTKGALYHHFANKTALGYAVVEEVIGVEMEKRWIKPVETADDPIDGLIALLRSMSCEDLAVACQMGCPLNNLAQEMSPVDEGFRRRIQAVYDTWRRGYAEALRRGQQAGRVREDIDPDLTALFIVSSLEGGVGIAKNAREPKHLEACGQALVSYIETLRAPTKPA